MPVRKLAARGVERVWGRTQLPDAFRGFESGAPVGEVWHEAAGEDPLLLVKHLFTSERLSIQVHPDDAAAQARGFPRGKDEAWFVLGAEPGATIGLGLKAPAERDAVRAAALDGTIEALVDWRPVAAGDFFYSPAGTIHAIGGGVALVEIQQNLDLTYRLYDYGRPRELQLADGMAVADPQPWRRPFAPVSIEPGRSILAAEGKFVVEAWQVEREVAWLLPADTVIVPLAGSARVDGETLDPAGVWQGEGEVRLESGDGIDLLIAYPGGEVCANLRA
jgi:mannose-6-phosphate isomerase